MDDKAVKKVSGKRGIKPSGLSLRKSQVAVSQLELEAALGSIAEQVMLLSSAFLTGP